MAARIAWVLNLDADLELAAGPGYTPKRTLRRAMLPFVDRLAASLLEAGDVLVRDDDDPPPPEARGAVGRAFCPTPRALAILRRAGAEPEPHPPLDVLRRVNSRGFASALGETLPGGRFFADARELDAARATLREIPPVGSAWRVKRAFGMTGRGQRVVAPGEATAEDRAFLEASFTEGGVQIEPNVAIVREHALHGMLAHAGTLRLGALVRQHCDARGAWLATAREEDAARDDADAGFPGLASRLEEEATRVAAALSSAGYFGPFGVDAFTYRGSEGELRLQPRSEINARYAMGFGIGFPNF